MNFIPLELVNKFWDNDPSYRAWARLINPIGQPHGFSVTQNDPKSCPQSQQEIIDSYFIEHRAKLIDIAAFLDRVDRGKTSDPDFRHQAFVKAIEILLSEQPHRAKRVLELFSVTDKHVPQSAQGLKGASGAVPLKGRS